MRIVLISSFPPCKRNLAEYGWALAEGASCQSDAEIIVLSEINSETGGVEPPKLEGVTVIPCWEKGSLRSLWQVFKLARAQNPDIIWFNLIYSTFGKIPWVALAGFSLPFLLKCSGFRVVATLHHLIDHIRPESRLDKLIWPLTRSFAHLLTHLLFQCDRVYLLLNKYVATAERKYRRGVARKISHGFLLAETSQPAHMNTSRFLVFGAMGTYKTLEPALAAMEIVWQKHPDIELVVTGENHPSNPFYLDKLALACEHLPIKFTGYVADTHLQKLFADCSIAILPYRSTTGASGVAHLACTFGLAIVASGVEDLLSLAKDEDMDITFTDFNDPVVAANQLLDLLKNPRRIREMGRKNFLTAKRKDMQAIAAHYLAEFRTLTGQKDQRDAA